MNAEANRESTLEARLKPETDAQLLSRMETSLRIVESEMLAVEAIRRELARRHAPKGMLG